MNSNNFKNKTYLVISYWDYPFGGGEEYMYQTMRWTKQAGMNNFWISFANSENKNHTCFQVQKYDTYTAIRISDGLDSKKLLNWIKLLNPDLVHHQGHYHDIIYEACDKLRLEYITGIHFWTNFIKLNQSTNNIAILDNREHHSIDPCFSKLYNSKYSTIYAVSDFVAECVENICNIKLDVVYSGSDEEKCLIERFKPIEQKYVTVINIHRLKGGELVLKLIETMTHIPFIVIQTEHHSAELDAKIYQAINNRNTGVKCRYFSRLDNVKYIYSMTRVFLAPSLVDETFCRTVHEAIMNGIPVLTTGCGNLKYLVNNDYCIISNNDVTTWIDKINELYNDTNLYQKISELMLQQYQIFSQKICKNRFYKLLNHVIDRSKQRNIMLYCPWCDQGLGIQCRNYYKILEKQGYNVFIFSYKPYNANSTIELQKNPSEWIVKNIYYSKYDREHVTNTEILNYVQQHNIGKCIIPETCWYRVFEIAKLLDDNHVKCYAIPNIEIVRKDELYKHTYFHKILCNNILCQTIFNKYNIINTEYIGYGIYDDIFEPTVKNIDADENVKFLFIGGMNAFSRKHVLEICEAICIASHKYPNITLTCTIQKTNQLEQNDVDKINNYANHPNIKLIQTHLSYQEIIELYNSHHVSIQVSKHEGLGLGFYEALSTSTPIITLDVAPHNEIIIDGVNGWIIPCITKPMTDNPNGLVESAYFNPNILADKIVQIVGNRDDLRKIYQNLVTDYIKRFDINIFETRFMNALQ